MLKHKPTGIVVRVHESRSQSTNVDIAYDRMRLAIDRHLNGENCYEEQLKRLETIRRQKNETKRRRSRELKATAKMNRDNE